VTEPARTLSSTDSDRSSVVVTSPAAQLFVVLECDRPLATPSRHVLGETDVAMIGRGTERAARRSRDGGLHRLELRVPDRLMSQVHVNLVRSRGRFVLEDAGAKNGVLINGTRARKAVLLDGDLIEMGHTCFLFRDAVPPITADRPDLAAEALTPPVAGLETFVSSFDEALGTLARVAPHDVGVVLVGASGTGKEVLARAVHGLSGRKGPFVAVNCGALPATLIEASLFGHRRGAFSGAIDDNAGLVRAADRGTLFLDEIADLPRAAQAALLRVLQEREVVAVGDTRPTKVDVRVLCASQRRLEELVAAGDFRADLFARLTGLTVALPPLAERREDLGLIIGALLRRLVGDRARERIRLAPPAARALLRYGWPLNVRELEKSLGTALALAGADAIELAHLPEVVRAAAAPAPAPTPTTATAETPAVELEPAEDRIRAELVALLTEHDGNISAVARAMGKGRMQIHRWVQRWGLDLTSFRR
jgi:transcriptional regulator with AAA-type ATPase domain